MFCVYFINCRFCKNMLDTSQTNLFLSLFLTITDEIFEMDLQCLQFSHLIKIAILEVVQYN